MRMQRRAMLIAAPLMLCFLFLYVFTFLYSLKYTVTESAFSPEFVGLKNYQQVFENKYFRLGVKNTFEIMAVSVPILVAFSLFLALEVSALGGNYPAFAGRVSFAHADSVGFGDAGFYQSLCFSAFLFLSAFQ